MSSTDPILPQTLSEALLESRKGGMILKPSAHMITCL